MRNRAVKIFSLILSLSLVFQQAGFAQMVGEVNIGKYLSGPQAASFSNQYRPLHMRYLSYDNLSGNFRLFLDTGDTKNLKDNEFTAQTQEIFKYFLVGITLPNDSFWVNLRPDSKDEIIDGNLEKTDVGKIMLEADLQLKKDIAQFTSPQTPQGRQYWDKLYKKAGEIFGAENVSIPTITRPWIVPNEAIIRYAPDSAYVYKASLKVMLEQDYLKNSKAYNFKDPRLKELNEYSSELIRQLILPLLTKEVNTAKRYAELRQVYYSLILAQWFKNNIKSGNTGYAHKIDSGNLTGLESKEQWSKNTYFQAYKKSFSEGEYNIKEPVYKASGQVIRSYVSGGVVVTDAGVVGVPAVGSQWAFEGALREEGLRGIVVGPSGRWTPIQAGQAAAQTTMFSSIAVDPQDRAVLQATGNDAARLAVVSKMFNQLFGYAPQLATKAGGRDNWQGEHVDYPLLQFFYRTVARLFSLGGAIQNNFMLAMAKNDSRMVRIVHLDAGQAFQFNLDELATLQQSVVDERAGKGTSMVPVWARHTLGVLSQAQSPTAKVLEKVGIKATQLQGMDIMMTSNVPFGGGLSNSAANCCAVVKALDRAYAMGLGTYEMARLAQAGEHDPFVNGSCGLLDQLLSLASQKGYLTMIDYGKLVSDPENAITQFKSNLSATLQRVLINTQVPHDLQTTEYKDRVRELELVFKFLSGVLGREIGSTSLTLADLNTLIYKLSSFTRDVTDLTLQDAGVDGMISLREQEHQETVFLDTRDCRIIVAAVEKSYTNPFEDPAKEAGAFMRHEGKTKKQSFVILLRRMRHQLTSSLRTPLTGKAAQEGNAAEFNKLITAEGVSLRGTGDFEITGANGAQDALLDIGFDVARELEIGLYSGRMEGGGGGGFDGFFVDRSDEARYQQWLTETQKRYIAWAKEHLGQTFPDTVQVIEPELAAGAEVLALPASPAPAAAKKATVESKPWGEVGDQAVSLFTLTNASGAVVDISTYGGTVVSVKVPDRNGALADVALGHDQVAPYADPDPSKHPYLGSTIGRYGNRIAGGKFTLDGITYNLPINNGPNSLHGGTEGFDRKVWSAETFETKGGVGVKLSYTSPDGEQGYPGELKVVVTYTWTNDNELKIEYSATTNKPTVVNLTNHTYWNLAGQGEGFVLGHKLKINANGYTPVRDGGAIPTGEVVSVAGTPFDFTTPHAIGERVEDDNEQLRFGQGYDHNWVLNKAKDGALTLAAEVEEPGSGRTMQVLTTEPAIQFYGGNFLDGTVEGKGGRKYEHRSGFCLETQHYPDSPNQPNFPSTTLRPGETYNSTTIYRFGVASDAGAAQPFPVGKGGIDFRHTDGITQAQLASLRGSFKMPELSRLKTLDLVKERAEIKQMIEARILPSSNRIIEYVSACYLRNRGDVDTGNAVSCLVDYFRLEEVQGCVDCAPELKAFLLVMEGPRKSVIR